MILPLIKSVCSITYNKISDVEKTLIRVQNYMGHPRPLLVYFRSFQTQIQQKKSVDVSGIQTRIVRAEGKHADHMTTTTAYIQKYN